MNAYAAPMEDRKETAERDAVVVALDSLKLRERKKVEREIGAGNVRFSQKLKTFVYTGKDGEDADKEYELKHGQDDDSDQFPDDDDSMSDEE